MIFESFFFVNTYLHGFRNTVILLYSDGYHKCIDIHMYAFL